jgi:hypothetical protein
MKILTATAHTQGKRDNDFNWCDEGEPVTTVKVVCDRDEQEGPDGGCGCGRSFGGMRSGKSVTTAMVRDVMIGPEDVAFIVRKYRADGGWTDLLGDPDESLPENPDGSIAEEAAEIIALAADYPVGAVLEIRMGEIGVREVIAEKYETCALAEWAYSHGTDPIDWAVNSVAGNQIKVYLAITEARAENPASFPGYTLEVSPEALARRIVGGLLDAGWIAPEARPS